MLPTSRSDHRHPSKSLVFLIFVALFLWLVFSFIGFGIAAIVFDAGLADLSTRNMKPETFKLLQAVITTGAFILPPLVLRFYERRYPAPYFVWNRKIQFQLVVLTMMIMMLANPLISATASFNEGIHLPEFLSGLEARLREKDSELKLLTQKLLQVHSTGGLLINLFVIAILPAVGEELFFRGGLQTIINRWTGNHHAAIWIVAVIFSSIHVQFLGFLPRMLLGAVLGYLFFWTGNVFFPMLAHFINNGTAVIAAYYFQLKGKSPDEFDQVQGSSWPLVLISIVATGLLLRRFYMYTSSNINHKNYGENE